MLKWVKILLIMIVNTVLGNTQTLVLRDLFKNAATNENAAIELYKMTHSSENSNSTWVGYKAISEFMLCNYTHNVYKKWTYFNSGKKLLEEAIIKDKNNIELNFLRYSVQKKLPAFLGYNQHLEYDKTLLKNFIKLHVLNNTTDPKFLEFIKQYEKI